MRRSLICVLLLILAGCQAKPPPPQLTTLEPTLVEIEQALKPQPKPALCPKPKSLKPLPGAPLVLKENLTVSSSDTEMIRHLEAGLGEPLETTDKEPGFTLEVNAQETPAYPGGYNLRVDEQGAHLTGQDRAGLFYALQTLLQLEDSGVIQPVEIRDWPSFPVRGVLLHTGVDSGPTHRRLLERALAPLKFNMLVLECEYAQWKSHPELWNPTLSVPREQLRQTAISARRHFVEPVPLIQTLSHMGWFYENEQHQKLGEPSLHYGLPVTEEAAWADLLDIYAEAIDVFQAKSLHIGIDEVRSLRGIYPGTEEPVEKVIVSTVDRLHDWLERREVRTMMWADMLLHRTEAASVGLAPSPEAAAHVRQNLPKDITLLDWQYEVEPPEFPEVGVLADEGYKVVGAPWHHAPTTLGFAGAVAKADGAGIIQTTWPGRVLNDRVVEGSEHYQFAALAVTAEAAWNGSESVSKDPAAVFAWLWAGRPKADAPRPGKALHFQGTLKEPMLPEGPLDLAGVAFTPGPAVKVGTGVQFDLPERPAYLAFLWATEESGKAGHEVARLEVEYADGETKSHPVRERKEIDSFESAFPAYRAPIAWQENARSIRVWRWKNPRPQVALRGVRLVGIPEAPQVLLFGVTVID